MIVDEDVECIADDDESESLKVFVWKTSDNDCDAYDAYNRYALRKGFGICKDGLQRFRATKEIMTHITHVTRKGLKGKTQDKKVEMLENITKLDVDVGHEWRFP